ncbi:hypothetical protein [Noviherbaspirillum pedocola]|uniref:Uncharacterized protein n=1 Tax=Noviherbaspirillum pedocola TaxID=2801341 RepID=A0A934STP4_9BURK|nr:hypothetical protein [Noviherbaspirillum pedocola]MBK4735487.1 hypothetical protein [Noviherbaspirillum pedocola]
MNLAPRRRVGNIHRRRGGAHTTPGPGPQRVCPAAIGGSRQARGPVARVAVGAGEPRAQRSRPLFPYLAVAQYTGKGSVD